MVCEKCSEAVHKTLDGIDSVTSVQTNVKAQLVVVEGSFAPTWQSAQDSGGSFVAGGDSPRRGAQQPEGSGGAARTPMRGLAQRLLIAGVAKAGGVASDGSFAIQDKGK